MGALSSQSTGKGRMQRIVLDLLHQKERDGEIPTNGRFVFYELEGRGVVRKSGPGESRRGSNDDPREQEVSDALTFLRDRGIVPWDWIVDETRVTRSYLGHGSVLDGLRYALDHTVWLDPWDGQPPLILCESRSLSGVLMSLAMDYCCEITATNGQARGHLHNDVAPRLAGNARPVLYLGDLDLQGDQIEDHNRRVLEREAGRELEWTRLAITAGQVAEHELTTMHKVDNRYRPAKPYEAVETEALGQALVQAMVRAALDDRLPIPLADVLEREDAERVRLRTVLAEIGGE